MNVSRRLKNPALNLNSQQKEPELRIKWSLIQNVFAGTLNILMILTGAHLELSSRGVITVIFFSTYFDFCHRIYVYQDSTFGLQASRGQGARSSPSSLNSHFELVQRPPTHSHINFEQRSLIL